MDKYGCHTQITQGELVICSKKAPRKQKVWEDFHALIWLVVLLCFFAILGIEPRTLHLLASTLSSPGPGKTYRLALWSRTIKFR